MKILASILATITGEARYFPEITWSSSSWTHNAFRLYESIFGRRHGIRAETTTSFTRANGKTVVTRTAHTFEGFCALFEAEIRTFLKNIIGYNLPYRLYIVKPQLATSTGVQLHSPYRFAIAFDAFATGTINSSATFNIAHTSTGSNLLMVAGYAGRNAGSLPTAAPTYNSVSLTQVGSNRDDGGGQGALASMFYLIAPTTGSSINVTCTAQFTFGCITTYSDCKQSAQPDSNNFGGSGTQNITVSTTVVASNCWVVGVGCKEQATNPGVVSTDRTERANASIFNTSWKGIGVDSNGTVSTGSISTAFNGSTTGASEAWCAIVISIAPVAAGGGTVLPRKALLGVGQ